MVELKEIEDSVELKFLPALPHVQSIIEYFRPNILSSIDGIKQVDSLIAYEYAIRRRGAHGLEYFIKVDIGHHELIYVIALLSSPAKDLSLVDILYRD